MKSLIKLGALVVVAAIGALVIRSLYLSASAPAGGKPASTAHVRAAADDLPAGLLLRDADLTWQAVPRDKVPAGALVQGSPEDNGANGLKGNLLRHAVRAGTPLGVADVIQPNAPGFLAAALAPGMRAISVAVDDVSGNAGLIEPGDFVDILLTQQMRSDSDAPLDPGRSVETETIAARVRVLAVGSAFRRPKEDESAPNEKARTVTVEVTPQSAESITVASHLGALSLALRSFATQDRHAPAADDTRAQIAPVWAGDVSRAWSGRAAAPAAPAPGAPAAVPHAAPPAPPRHVVIYRGSNVADADDGAAEAARGAATVLPSDVPPLPAIVSTGAQLAAAFHAGQ